MNAYKFKNFINNDPILDFLKIHQLYKKDTELRGFDEELLLENYTKNNKKILCEKIFGRIGDDAIKIAPDAFVMKTRKIDNHFKNPMNVDTAGDDYSLFTIEYGSLSVLKNGRVSTTHKYYNFKNWLHTLECRYKIDGSFILGRKYSTYDSYDMLAHNPYKFEDLMKQGNEHFNSIRTRTIGVDLFPNMKNTSDFPYHNAKKLISEEYQELTSLKGISAKERDEYVNKGIFKRSQLDYLKRSDKKFVNFNKLPLVETKDTKLLFIDFEILTNVYDDFASFPKSNNKDHLFNVGCCYFDMDTPLSLVSRNVEDEKDLMISFIDFLNSVDAPSVTFVHWTHIEKRVFEQKMKEYDDIVSLDKEVFWFDLHDYFLKSDIYIENCLNYKLKIVSRCLEKMGHIESKWDNGLFFDGLGAMTGFIKYLKTGDESILNEIINYNVIDCKVMMEIYDFLQKDLDVPNS